MQKFDNVACTVCGCVCDDLRVEVDGEGLPNRELVVTLEITNPKGDKRTLDKPFKLSAGQGGPPHAQIEFEIDAAQFGSTPPEGKRPELEEGPWQFRARIPKDRREIFVGKEHVSEKQTVQIVKRNMQRYLIARQPPMAGNDCSHA